MKRFVRWSSRARADIRALDRETALKIFESIDRYLMTGAGDAAQLRPPLTALRMRVGDWRILFEPGESENSMQVLRVLHRSVAYRRQ